MPTKHLEGAGGFGILGYLSWRATASCCHSYSLPPRLGAARHLSAWPCHCLHLHRNPHATTPGRGCGALPSMIPCLKCGPAQPGCRAVCVAILCQGQFIHVRCVMPKVFSWVPAQALAHPLCHQAAAPPSPISQPLWFTILDRNCMRYNRDLEPVCQPCTLPSAVPPGESSSIAQKPCNEFCSKKQCQQRLGPSGVTALWAMTQSEPGGRAVLQQNWRYSGQATSGKDRKGRKLA